MDISYKTTCTLIINLGFNSAHLDLLWADKAVGWGTARHNADYSKRAQAWMFALSSFLSKSISWCIEHVVGGCGLMG